MAKNVFCEAHIATFKQKLANMLAYLPVTHPAAILACTKSRIRVHLKNVRPIFTAPLVLFKSFTENSYPLWMYTSLIRAMGRNS